MANFSDDFDFTKMVNEHSDEIKRKEMLLDNAHLSYEAAAKRSFEKSNEKVELKKAEKRKSELRKAAITALLIASLVLGANALADVATKNPVDERVDYYMQVMGTDSNASHMQIEFAHELNGTTGREKNVSYAPGNLENDILEAAKIDEVEVRTAILAAYKTINEPYRNGQFEILLKSLADNPEITSQYAFFESGDIKDFLKALGYDSWEDYHMHERANIKNLAKEMDMGKASGGRKNG